MDAGLISAGPDISWTGYRDTCISDILALFRSGVRVLLSAFWVWSMALGHSYQLDDNNRYLSNLSDYLIKCLVVSSSFTSICFIIKCTQTPRHNIQLLQHPHQPYYLPTIYLQPNHPTQPQPKHNTPNPPLHPRGHPTLHTPHRRPRPRLRPNTRSPIPNRTRLNRIRSPRLRPSKHRPRRRLTNRTPGITQTRRGGATRQIIRLIERGLSRGIRKPEILMTVHGLEGRGAG